MNDQAEITCSDCGKPYQPDLATGLGGGCPHCLARMLAEETLEEKTRGDGPAPLAAGDMLGGVEILEPLARGGMGVVYKARQPKLNRVVAIKVIDAKLAGIPEFTQRFEREARALAVLNHPHVVQVFDYGHEGDLCFLVMEWVNGTSLREILASGHLSPDDALRYVPQICDALEYAHAQGLVHRDIKPENILIDRQGLLKIADFGIARMRGDDETATEFVTRAGQMMGTPHYMAPEQQKHTDRVDHRADLYSLGVVFYEMLTGELPLGRFPTPSQRVKVDVTLDEVVLKTLEQDPNRRYQRASEIKQALTAPPASSSASPAPADPPAAVIPAGYRPPTTAFAGWSFAFAVMSLLVLWEMTRPWIFSPEELGRSFFTNNLYTMLLRPLSIVSLVLAWVFGWLTLWRVRQAQGQLSGLRLAIAGMIVPVLLLALLVHSMVLPLTLRAFVTHDLIVLVVLVPAIVVFLGLRGVFRCLRRYTSDPAAAAPVKSSVATVVVTLGVGWATWAVAHEWGEAEKRGHALYKSLLHDQMSPTAVPSLDPPTMEDSEHKVEFFDRRNQLKFLVFGDKQMRDLDYMDRFAYERVDGEPLIGWMPPSHRYVYVGEGSYFRDQRHFMWIHEFDLEGDLLTVEYEFPVRGGGQFITFRHEDAEEAGKMEEVIRNNYGVEPDTVYRAQVRVSDLNKAPYRPYMTKEFWQSAERVDNP